MLARSLQFAKHFLFPEQKIVVMLDAQNCGVGGLVPAFWHPFWDLGDILGDRGRSSKDMQGSGVVTGSISGAFLELHFESFLGTEG